jgi:uncharacterized delta-60 repeat protein
MRFFLSFKLVFLFIIGYTQDGVIDLSLGTGGKAFYPISDTLSFFPASTAIQQDGKIICVGSIGTAFTGSDFITIRLNQNGTVDPSFGNGGYVITAFGEADRATCIAIQKDGKILIAGYSGPASRKENDFVIARLNQDGTPDLGFDTDGKLITSFSTYDSYLWSIVLQPDGKILVGGDFDKTSTNDNYDFVVARYNTDGSPDNSFGINGWVNTDLGRNERIFALALYPDGRIAGAGLASNLVYARFGVVRYKPDGRLDSSFNGTGTIVLSTRPGFEAARSVVIQDDGRIIIGGYSARGDALSFDKTLIRFNENGLLDNSFGVNGIVLSTTGVSNNNIGNILLQQDNKIVLTGTATIGDGNVNYVVSRYKQDGSPDSSFGINSKAIIPIGPTTNFTIAAYSSVFQGNKIIVSGIRRRCYLINTTVPFLVTKSADGKISSIIKAPKGAAIVI